MKSNRALFLLLLFLIPAASIFYKVSLKNVSFIPTASSNAWNIEMTYDLNKIAEDHPGKVFSLPLITSWQQQKVDIKKIASSHRYNISPSFGSRAIEVIPDPDESLGKVTVTARLSKKSTSPGNQIRSKIYTDAAEVRRKYLLLNVEDPEIEQKLRNLNSQIVSPNDDSLEKIRKIYYYVTEEVLRSAGANTLDDILNLREGSDWGRSLLLASLARINGIPTRINIAIQSSGVVQKGQMADLRRTYFPEILLGEYWYPIDIITNHFMRVPNNHFILYQDAEQFRRNFQPKDIQIYIAPVMVNKVDSKTYYGSLRTVSKVLSYFSLHSLPLSQQSTFYIVLLIPIGTLLLSFFRNIVGLKSFGIFTPILLSLFFLETSFSMGLVFFGVIVMIGFAQRFILDKFYLLAVPRLSILLTLVILVYMLMSLIFHHELLMGPKQSSINYFPIVIITVFIERFSVHFIEEGFRSSLKTLVGTFIIAIFCYLAFRSEFLRLTLFNHPELLLWAIGSNFLIGNYKGYRVSEFIRFQELVKGRRVQ